MKRTWGLAIVAVLAGVSLLTLAMASQTRMVGAGHDSSSRARVPVVVELFTSEGCSSCPPADSTLAWLKRDQPVEGAQVIALSEHVDYWNYIGWQDPFSSRAFSARQTDYMRAFHLDQVYTPQAVIDGQAEFVGSDRERAVAEIARAARAPRADVRLTLDRSASGELALRVRVENAPQVRAGDTADVLLATTEDNLHSNVARGENSGRKLEHVAVVRQLRRIGSLAGHEPFTASTLLPLNSAWKCNDLSAAVFVQERGSRRILGAATLPLSR